MKIIKWLDKHFEESILILFLTFMLFSMCLQVVMRYVFNNSLSWPEEFGRYLFLGSTFISISYCIKLDNSIKIDLIVDFLPKEMKKIVTLLSHMVCFFFFVYLTSQAFTVLVKSYEGGQKSTAMQIPMYFLYLSVLVSFLLSAIRSAQRICFVVKKQTKGE